MANLIYVANLRFLNPFVCHCSLCYQAEGCLKREIQIPLIYFCFMLVRKPELLFSWLIYSRDKTQTGHCIQFPTTKADEEVSRIQHHVSKFFMRLVLHMTMYLAESQQPQVCKIMILICLLNDFSHYLFNLTLWISKTMAIGVDIPVWTSE